MAEAAKKVKKQTSAEKRMKQSIERRTRNTQAKSRLKTTFKKVNESIPAGNLEETKKLVKEAASTIDREARKGTVHKNKAARKKSRLMKKINAISKEKA